MPPRLALALAAAGLALVPGAALAQPGPEGGHLPYGWVYLGAVLVVLAMLLYLMFARRVAVPQASRRAPGRRA